MLFDWPLSQGLKGLRETVLAMAALIRIGARSPLVRKTARAVTRNAKNDPEKIGRVFFWIKRRMRYQGDPLDIEQIKTADRMVREIDTRGNSMGDCDDYTVLFGSLLEALQIKTRILVLQTMGHSFFNHVIPEARVGGKWIPLDATVRTAKPNELHGRVIKKLTFAYR